MSSLFNAWISLLSITVVLGGIVSCIRVRVPGTELANTSVAVARDRFVVPFLASLEDGRFGFPSGRFAVRVDGESRVVAREFVLWKPTTFDLTARIWQGASDAGGIGRVIGAIALFVYWTAIGVWLTLAEYAGKLFMRSTITAEVEPKGDSGSEVHFTARGPSALLLRSRLRSAFAVPRLPPNVASRAGLTAPVAGSAT